MQKPAQKQGTSTACMIEKEKRYTKGELKLLEKARTLEKVFKIDIMENVKKKYPKEYLDLFGFDDDKLDKELKELLKTCGFQKEDRTYCQYAVNLIINLELQDIIEEIIRSFLKIHPDVTVGRGGADAGRRFVEGNKITGETDMVITIGDKQYHIEIVADYGVWWAKNNPIDLRDFKLSSLISKTKKYEKVFVLALSLVKGEFALIEIHNNESLYDLTQYWNYSWKRNCQKLQIDYKKQFTKLSKLPITVYGETKVDYNNKKREEIFNNLVYI